MTETGSDLRFDRATYASPGAGTAAPCGTCKQPLGERYWKWQRHIVCGACRDKLAATLASSQSASSFGKALLHGGGTALACGIAYAVFVALTKFQIAFATIGIAFVIARVVRKASRGVSGRRFQVLAVALTYLASAMGYAPGVLGALGSAKQHHAAPAVAPAGGAPAAAPPDPPTAPESTTDGAREGTEKEPTKKAMGPLGLVLGVTLVVAITLAAPFLELTEAPLGFLIILFGLWEAWKLSRGVSMEIDGPFRVAPQATPPPAT